jgi:hypothetical protein
MSPGLSAQEATPVADVRALFASGSMLRDRNGDGINDDVAVRIVVPANAGEAEFVAAANLAARLGYETSALDLGLLLRDDGARTFDMPVLFVGGSETAGGPGATRGVGAGGLAPGQGVLLPIPRAGRFGGGGARILGYDATGLLAVAAYAAGRHPTLWDMEGPTVADAAARFGRFLAASGAGDAIVSIDGIVVDARRPGVTRLAVNIRAPDATTFAAAVRALESRDSAAARGDTTGVARADTFAAARVDTTAGARGATQDSARRAASGELEIRDVHRIDATLVGPDSSRTFRLLPARPWATESGAAFTARESADFTLSDLYSIRGLFRDTNQDLVPDRTEAYLAVAGGAAGAELVDLAARIGLETAGIRLPLAELSGEEDRLETNGFPIVFGADHYQIERLRREDRLHASDFGPGSGFIELMPRAFGGRNGLVIGGSDASGAAAAASYVARRMPYLWEHGKGRYHLADVETAVRRFVQARDAGGQVALAVHTLDRWLARLAGRPVDSLHIVIAAHEAEDGLAEFAADRARARFPDARVTSATHTTGFGVGKPIFTEVVPLPWEVDEVRAALRSDVLPSLDAGSRGRIEVRLSEPPEVRADLTREIRDLLETKGVTRGAFDVVVLSAYKQGYSWIEDVILPELRERPVARIEIAYHTLRDSREVRWQAVESETRWLQELYPIDAVLARELGVADSSIVFVPTLESEPIYRVRAFDAAGNEILSETFTPRYVVRPFFDLFPEYERVRVTTGWLTAVADGDTLLDRRIRTDPEAFWDHLQTETFARIIEYMMDVQEGRPSPGNAPYFDEFRIELELSEPNNRIGVDEEVISSLEALHEDIYFETLTLFDLLGGRYGVDGLQFAGRVLPYILPTGAGKAGRAHITFTGKERAVPELTLTYRERGGEPVRQSYALAPLPIDAPKLRGIAVRAPGIDRLLFEVAVRDSVDRWEELRGRSSESAIDRSLPSTELVAGMLAATQALHAAGLYEDALAFDRAAALRFRLVVDDTTSTHARQVDVPRTRHPLSTERPVLLAPGFRPDDRRLVQWDTPIPPAESDSVMAKLNTFPGVDVYWVGRSFLGKDIFAADFLPAFDAAYVSQAKLNALRPTLLLSGRQHANEVSSTSHILRLGELLATDSAYRALRDRVNIVLHPITNPDGAELAYQMQRTNPDFMLHAGYLGALGVDATSGANSTDPIYPESQVRPKLQATWLPDIYINMHGYPSHEWVQHFAGYSAWVRSRTGTQRSWWAPRGWFIPGYTAFEVPNEKKWETAQFAILDTIAAAITGDPEVDAMNRRLYARYRKYGKQDVENFREYFHNGILVYLGIRPREVSGTGPSSPKITYFSSTTEAPDETARGAWLDLVARAGLAHGAALARYLASGVNEVKRESAEFENFVTRSVFRVKPVVPKTAETANGARRP